MYVCWVNNTPITVALKYEARVCGLSNARIMVSNTADDMGCSLVFVTYRAVSGLCDGVITGSEEPYCVCECVCVSDLET
jgi:hypothetical protein